MNDGAFIQSYFTGERFGAALFIAVGLGALALSAWLLWRRSHWRGMLVPLLIVGLIQIAVGATVWQRSAAQAAGLQQQFQHQPQRFKLVELRRMQAVTADLANYRQIKIGLLALGMALAVLLRRHEYGFAFGLALVLQAAAMLALDHFAAARAAAYVGALRAV